MLLRSATKVLNYQGVLQSQENCITQGTNRWMLEQFNLYVKEKGRARPSRK
jgi:hypothetical protein